MLMRCIWEQTTIPLVGKTILRGKMGEGTLGLHLKSINNRRSLVYETVDDWTTHKVGLVIAQKNTNADDVKATQTSS